MSKLEQAVERIKALECPTGEVEYRVADILDDYGVANRNDISIKRDRSLDKNGAEGYLTNISNNKDKSIVILAKSGMDDYVAKIEDAYIRSWE